MAATVKKFQGLNLNTLEGNRLSNARGEIEYTPKENGMEDHLIHSVKVYGADKMLYPLEVTDILDSASRMAIYEVISI